MTPLGSKPPCTFCAARPVQGMDWFFLIMKMKPPKISQSPQDKVRLCSTLFNLVLLDPSFMAVER